MTAPLSSIIRRKCAGSGFRCAAARREGRPAVTKGGHIDRAPPLMFHAVTPLAKGKPILAGRERPRQQPAAGCEMRGKVVMMRAQAA